jgi:hypothetical protein
MVNVTIATSAEQPINSDGAVPAEVGQEGDLVGLNGSGEVVQADAATGVAIPAVGVLATPIDDESTYPTGQFEFAAKTAEANRASIQNGKKVGFVRYGAEIHNRDEDWNFTPGEPVFLGEGGGWTQTKPSNSGDLVQYVGWAAPDGETVFLDIDGDYTTV